MTLFCYQVSLLPFECGFEVGLAHGAVVQVDGGAGVGLLDEDGGRFAGVGEPGTAVAPAV